ncbi:MAG: tRNA pseudouridine(55) synthase TruB [Leptospiraceae bacterium]|nr:tRNA pseudouridine(55) synthase TruB [Leptospiraceae bacterium]
MNENFTKSGFFLVDKPIGMTSSDVVIKIKKKFSISRIGHTGTLDKFATGLLILPFGKATSFADKFLHSDKTYEATASFGKSTDSGDIDGIITEEWDEDAIKEYYSKNSPKILSSFEDILNWEKQTAPKISALKVNGKRQAELFRKNISFETKERNIKITNFKLTQFNEKEICFQVRVSSGTYIRKLIIDLSEKLNFPMHLTDLRRLSIGKISIDNAKTLEFFLEGNIEFQSIEPMIDLPKIKVNKETVKAIKHGINAIESNITSSEFLLLDENENLIAWMENKGEGSYKFKRVFV